MPSKQNDRRNGRDRVAKQTVERGATRLAEAAVGSPSEADEPNMTNLGYELRNLLASIQLAVDTMAYCRATCPVAGMVRSNVRSQIPRLSKLLDDLDCAAVAPDRDAVLMGR